MAWRGTSLLYFSFFSSSLSQTLSCFDPLVVIIIIKFSFDVPFLEKSLRFFAQDVALSCFNDSPRLDQAISHRPAPFFNLELFDRPAKSFAISLKLIILVSLVAISVNLGQTLQTPVVVWSINCRQSSEIIEATLNSRCLEA